MNKVWLERWGDLGWYTESIYIDAKHAYEAAKEVEGAWRIKRVHDEKILMKMGGAL